VLKTSRSPAIDNIYGPFLLVTVIVGSSRGHVLGKSFAVQASYDEFVRSTLKNFLGVRNNRHVFI
jgi:hypothetical protein